MSLLTTLVVPQPKLVAYLLDADHDRGGSKAKFFLQRGFSRTHPEELAAALNEQAASDLSERTTGEASDGRAEKRLIAIGPIACPDGTAPLIKSIWKFREGEEVAFLVTAYPARRPRQEQLTIVV